MDNDAFFVVNRVADVIDDNGVRIVGITEDPDNDEARSLMFMDGPSYTNQDRRLGQDTYCVCDEQQRIAYGAVESYHVTNTALVLNLTENGSDSLDLPRQMILELKLNDHDVDVLRNGLSRIIDRGDCARSSRGPHAGRRDPNG